MTFRVIYKSVNFSLFVFSIYVLNLRPSASKSTKNTTSLRSDSTTTSFRSPTLPRFQDSGRFLDGCVRKRSRRSRRRWSATKRNRRRSSDTRNTCRDRCRRRPRFYIKTVFFFFNSMNQIQILYFNSVYLISIRRLTHGLIFSESNWTEQKLYNTFLIDCNYPN